MADMTVPDPVTRDVLASFENVRYRLFERLEGLTDAEYLWGPVGDNVSWISRDEECAPCYLGEMSECNYGHSCIRNLLPADVASVAAPEVLGVLSRRQVDNARRVGVSN